MNYDHSPDIVAVQSAGSLSVLTGLAGQISSDGGPAYTAFWYAGNDVTGLANGFLIDTSKIDVITTEQVGQTATYSTTSGSTATLFDRPSMVSSRRVPIPDPAQIPQLYE